MCSLWHNCIIEIHFSPSKTWNSTRNWKFNQKIEIQPEIRIPELVSGWIFNPGRRLEPRPTNRSYKSSETVTGIHGGAGGTPGGRWWSPEPSNLALSKIQPESSKISTFWLNFWISRAFVNYIENKNVRLLIWSPEPALATYGQKIMNRFFENWISQR